MKTFWLLGAYLGCVAGLGWLALAMDPHWRQLRGGQPLARGTARTLRMLGVAAVFASLLACLRADHASMASLVWVMTLAAAALTVAFALSWRPALLAPLLVPVSAWPRRRR
ncbi:MAG TPA: DUF3325 domain-containing protein [Methylibium sp.]|uniref:DUF3325 domain-containing protein n=1 Tax=Methylibium sp. TaxID=2067992 RepID=UPI002DBB17D2|nr:DUF3325 domain-containing protein [Methylibium sp.]HEU4460764.1 DUF3325 domain-containing protein [Methylibium sp.]